MFGCIVVKDKVKSIKDKVKSEFNTMYYYFVLRTIEPSIFFNSSDSLINDSVSSQGANCNS